jgi:hypothetical protein
MSASRRAEAYAGCVAADLIDELDGLLATLERSGVECILAGWPAFTIHRLPCRSDRIEVLVINEGASLARQAMESSRLEADVLVTSLQSALWSDRVRASWRGRTVVLPARDCLAARCVRDRPMQPQRPTRNDAIPTDEVVTQRLEKVRALYHLERSLRAARIIRAASGCASA